MPTINPGPPKKSPMPLEIPVDNFPPRDSPASPNSADSRTAFIPFKTFPIAGAKVFSPSCAPPFFKLAKVLFIRALKL